jgi:hypothetical protein
VHLTIGLLGRVRTGKNCGSTALAHVIYRLRDVTGARQLDAVLAHPGLKIADQRRDALAAHRQALVDAAAVDLALDVEDRVDAFTASKASEA